MALAPGHVFEARACGKWGRLRHNGGLSPRRVLFAAAILLALAALLSSLSPREQRAVTPTRSQQDAAAERLARTVSGRLPADKVVRAREGSVVELEVMSPQADEVQIDDLGVSAPVQPDLPAELRFVADEAGRFPVTLRDSGERLGTLEVTPAR